MTVNAVSDTCDTGAAAVVVHGTEPWMLVADVLMLMLVVGLTLDAAVQPGQAPSTEEGWDKRNPGAAQAAYGLCSSGGFGGRVERGQETVLTIGQVAATLCALVLMGVLQGRVHERYDGRDRRRDRAGGMVSCPATDCTESARSDQAVPVPILESVGKLAIFNPICSDREDRNGSRPSPAGLWRERTSR